MSRPSIENRTSKKKPEKPQQRLAFKQHIEQRKPGDAHNILSFCASRGISESFYHSLKRQNRQPREIEINGRVIITERTAEDWDREREAETAAKRQKAAEAEAAARRPAVE
jgi:hypothetical protein